MEQPAKPILFIDLDSQHGQSRRPSELSVRIEKSSVTSSCSFKEDGVESDLNDEEKDMWVIDNDDIALDVKDNRNYNKYK